MSRSSNRLGDWIPVWILYLIVIQLVLAYSVWKFSLEHEIGRSYYNYYQIGKYALFCDGISKNGINTNCHFYSDHNWLILDLVSRKTFWYKIPKADIG